MTEITKFTNNWDSGLYLSVTPEQQRQAREKAREHSHALARYNAYLNQICLAVFLDWISRSQFGAGEFGGNLELAPETATPVSVFPDGEIANLLEALSGTAIQLGERRLVLIPGETTEPELKNSQAKLAKICVPREWVDTPWAADYYLAVQLDLDAADEEECLMRVCGFATYCQVKSADYDPKQRAYVLPVAELTEDLLVMELTLEKSVTSAATGLAAARDTCVTAAARDAGVTLPALPETKVRQLLERLGNSSLYFPRLELDVPFEDWAALFLNPKWRQELYDRRMGRYSPVKLKERFNNIVALGRKLALEGWQTFDEITATLGMQHPAMAYRFGTAATFRDNSDRNPNAIGALIELLETSKDELTQMQVVELLSNIGKDSPEAIAALARLLETSSASDNSSDNSFSKELRRQAAIGLGKIDPTHPQAGIKRAKKIDLEVKLDRHSLTLVVTIVPQSYGAGSQENSGASSGASSETDVHLQVYGTDRKILPPDLQLIVLEENGEEAASARSRSADNWIQLEFSVERGTRFSVQLALGDASSISEFFL